MSATRSGRVSQTASSSPTMRRSPSPSRKASIPSEFVAFAPDEHFAEYSYASELLSQDGAVASLIACAAALHRIRDRIEGPWNQALAWIDAQLNRLWKARGAFPGLGSALSAFGYEWGFQHGSLLAYEIELLREKKGGDDPWKLTDAVMEDPAKLDGASKEFLSAACGMDGSGSAPNGARFCSFSAAARSPRIRLSASTIRLHALMQGSEPRTPRF